KKKKKEYRQISLNCITCKLEDIFNEMYCGITAHPMDVTEMVYQIWLSQECSEVFADYHIQQDCHELYMKLVTMIHSSNTSLMKTLSANSNGGANANNKMEEAKKNNKIHTALCCSSCAIHQVFEGVSASQIMCGNNGCDNIGNSNNSNNNGGTSGRKCSYTNTTYEAFCDLSLDLRHTLSNGANEKKESKHGWMYCHTLQECLKNFVSAENIMSYRCPQCQSPKDMSKRISIEQLPKNLTLHLKRFEDEYGGGVLQVPLMLTIIIIIIIIIIGKTTSGNSWNTLQKSTLPLDSQKHRKKDTLKKKLSGNSEGNEHQSSLSFNDPFELECTKSQKDHSSKSSYKFCSDNSVHNKIDHWIEFPVDECLEMSPFMSNSFKHCPNLIPSTYELKAVIQHLGSLETGHYTCYVKKGKQWFLLDDTLVEPVSSDTVKKCQAYMLFYEQVRCL
ncbi:hypothetical protein RFI_32655, partial [Reticulomyxa filosa]